MTWAIAWADVFTAKLDELLADGWEPFAVSAGDDAVPDRVYFRRATVAAGGGDTDG